MTFGELKALCEQVSLKESLPFNIDDLKICLEGNQVFPVGFVPVVEWDRANNCFLLHHDPDDIDV